MHRINKKATEEFKIKINEYTENLKIYTERIRAQKEVCQKKSLKMENAKLNNKKKSYIKKQQIKTFSALFPHYLVVSSLFVYKK